MPSGSCRDLCLTWTKTRPKYMPFLSHSYCRLCGVWYDKEEIDSARCECCNNILAIKPRLNQNKRKYNAVMNSIKWKKLHVPVKEYPFGDHVDKTGVLE